MNCNENLSEPNELGYQFCIDKGLTNYCSEQRLNFHVIQVWRFNELITRILIDSKTGDPIKEEKNIEQIKLIIEMLKISK